LKTDSLPINLQSAEAPPASPVIKLPAKPDRLFVGTYCTGIVFCDREREQFGDYMKLAMVFFDSLDLKWYTDKNKVPADLKEYIEASAQNYQSRRGELIAISVCGQADVAAGLASSQTRELGSALSA
jgi:hypothetical protein